MVVQYPHTIKVTPTPPGAPPRDAHGNWIKQEPVPPAFFLGRYENISVRRNSSFRDFGDLATDGAAVQDMGIIYAPLTVADLPLGAALEVRSGDVVMATGKAKGFLRGQLNCRIWLQA